MKKKLFGLMLLVLVLLLVAVGTAQADAPNSVEKYCSVCKTDRTFIRVGFACITGAEHNSIYNCTTCIDEAIWTEYREAHLIIPATCTENQKCVFCDLEDYAWQYNGYATGHDWGEWTFNGGGTHTRTCTNDATHTETGNCKSYTWEYDANSHKKTWTCSVCPGGADTKIEQDHVYTGDTDLSCDLCGYVRTVEGALSITGSMPAATVGVAYSVTFGYTGTASGVVFWNAVGLPEGLSINHGSGTVSGTPTTAGEYAVTISMGATGGGSAAEDFTLTVNEPAHTHDWGDWVSNGDDTHTRTCKTNSSHTETGNCSGGTATCVAQAVCEVCGEAYGEIDDANCSGLSEWEMVDDSEHYAYCSACKTHVFENHTSDDSSCTPTCTVCKQQYLDPDGEHGSMTDWEYKDETRHIRVCTGCGAPEYADHYGGFTTCTDKAVCTGCGTAYGEVNPIAHSWQVWRFYNSEQHMRVCRRQSDHYELAAHTGGNPTCTEAATCTVCGSEYHDIGNHANYGTTDWMPLSNGTHHSKLCLGCGADAAVGEHSFGAATCTEPAKCVCGATSGDPLGHDWGEWKQSGTQYAKMHTRACLNVGCVEIESSSCSGGTPTCVALAVCDTCDGEWGGFGSHVLGEYYQHPEWNLCHARDCTVAGCDETQFGNHTGEDICTKQTCTTCGLPWENGHDWDWGNAIANNDATCYGIGTKTVPCSRTGCTGSMQIGNPDDPQKSHSYVDYVSNNNATCTANATETAKCKWFDGSWCTSEHTRDIPDSALGHAPGAAATCTTDQLCTREGCGAVLTEKLGHTPGAAATCTTDQLCTRDGCGAVLAEKLGHTPGEEATCTTDQLCTREGCGAVLTEKLGHDWGSWADNGDGSHTRTCGNDAAHTETADCTWGDWAFLTDTHHERRCTVCNAQQLGEHTGGTATCSEPCTCDVCGDHYGSPDNSGLTGHPDPTVEVQPATCLTDGYHRITCDEPGCSAPFTEIIIPANGQHLYNHWDILGECEHHTACVLCGEEATVGCTLFGMLDGETLLTVCPVCGDFGETPFEVLIAREDAMVPIGTLLVRGLKAPIPGALWGFTVAGVYGGEVVDIHGMVTVTLPVDLTELGGLTVVRVDMVDGEEIRTEIPFTLEDGLLTIQTDTAGLFLLIPAE